MRNFRNEPAVRQHVDNQRGTVSIVPSGSMFRFTLDVLTFQEASDGLEGYAYWIEALRSGLYETTGSSSGSTRCQEAILTAIPSPERRVRKPCPAPPLLDRVVT